MTHLAAEPSTVLSFHIVRIGDAPVFPADEALCSSRSFAPTYLSSFHLSLPVLDLRFPYPFFQKKWSLDYSPYSTSPNPFVSVTGPCRFKMPALLLLSLPVFLLSPPCAPRPDLPYCSPSCVASTCGPWTLTILNDIGLAQPGLPGGAFGASLQGPGKEVAAGSGLTS